MTGIFRALAVDFDGTLTLDGKRPAQHVLDALARARVGGCRVLLVTGRVLTELRADWPDVDNHVDDIVAENGCVLYRDGQTRLLAPAVDSSLAPALTRRGISVRAGEALLACDGTHAVAVMEQIHELGLDAQLVHNREALMILPAGVTKGSGLFEALGDIGVSRHSTIGVGDAENDHALLDVCEVGVAVGNAVPALRRHADVVLRGEGGDGVVELIDGPIFDGRERVRSRRWEMVIGTGPTGQTVTLPTSQSNLLICGNTGQGKSYAAGLLAERLIALGYCVLVVDPEGDHGELGRLRGTITIDAADGLPPASRIAAMFRQRFTSVVLDMSCLDPSERRAYLDSLAVEVSRQRRDVGLPHWVILDEAHIGEPESLVSGYVDAGGHHRGQILVTYRPYDLPPAVLERLDGIIALAGDGPLPDQVVEIAQRVSGLAEPVIRHLAGGLSEHDALVAVRPEIGTSSVVTLATRTTPQVRHAHKYGATQVRSDRRFYFRDRDDKVTDVAGSMDDLRSVLARVSDSVLVHHAAGSDLSRWVSTVFQDRALGGVISEAEQSLNDGRISASEARTRVLAGVERRYPV